MLSRDHALDISCEHSSSIFKESHSKQFGLFRILRILSNNQDSSLQVMTNRVQNMRSNLSTLVRMTI